MYGKDSPAANVQVLVRFLMENKTQRQFFRGQNRYRVINAPSSIRSAIIGQIDNWNELDQNYWKRASHRVQAKDGLRVAVLTTFGRGLGNILCQQYGISSDAYDVTGDPMIAAFFATRRYPTYEQFVPSGDEDECGIIYRVVAVKGGTPDFEAAERTINSLHLIADERRQIAFTDVIAIKSAALHGLLKVNPTKYIDEQIPGEKTSIELVRPALCLSPDIIRRAFLDQSKQLKLDGDLAALFRSGRAYRQRGGIYYPSMRHSAITNRVVHAGEMLGKRIFRADPPIALSLGATHVYELNAAPNVERFFFRHNREKEIKIDDLNLLWPAADADQLLQLLCGVAEHVCKQYLMDYKTTVLDDEMGLIDRGFRAVS